MPLKIPSLDDRGYRDLLAEALARIPVHNPEWTNFNDSDPGVTLLQLFAFMTETLLYRSNLIPERNRLKFLTLLGIPLRPAAAAQGVVSFANERGPAATLTLPSGLTVQAGAIGFVTENALDILPLEGRVYIRRALAADEEQRARDVYEQLYSAFADEPGSLQFYKTVPFPPPTSSAAIGAVDLADDSTVDHSVWLALIARPGDDRDTIRGEIAGKTLTLGMMPAVVDSTRVLRSGGPLPEQATAPPLIYEIATGHALGPDRLPGYDRIDARPDDNPLENLTLVQLTLPAAQKMGVWDDLEPIEDGVGDFPPSLEDVELSARVVTWIRIRAAADPAVTSSRTAVPMRFSWIGINASRAVQRIDVRGEPVGTGSGEPDQELTLANTPVIAESVELFVNSEPWHRTDDMAAAAPEVAVRTPAMQPGADGSRTGGALTVDATQDDARVFTIDRESGAIRFGDGLRGARPQAGAPIIANYAFGGGRSGNVGIGSIRRAPYCRRASRSPTRCRPGAAMKANRSRKARRGFPDSFSTATARFPTRTSATSSGERRGSTWGASRCCRLFIPRWARRLRVW